METMQPTLKNGRNVWDRINMPRSEFEERLKKIRRAMKGQGIDLLLLYGNAFDEYGNYCYLSNYVIRLPRGAMVAVARKGDISLMFEGASRGIPSVKKVTWIKDVRACGDLSRECVKYMKEKRLIPSTVGFAGLKGLMPYAQWQVLSDGLGPCKVVDADHLLKMRMVKSQREVDQIRRASRVVVHAFDVILETAFPSRNEATLEAMVRREARLEGAEDFRMMIAIPGEENWAFHPPEDRQIATGKSLIIYLAVEFERYWAEAVRTFVAKGASFERPELERLQALYEKVVQTMKPGKTVTQVYKEIMEEMREGHGDVILDYGLGQGIGLSPKEFPVISGEDETALKNGMCFSLRLGVKDKDLGAVMIGNTLHLTKKGPEVLTRTEGVL